jgi:hypothetical protein
LTRWLPAIKQSKAAIIAELQLEQRRAKVLAMLRDNLGIRYAIEVADANTDPVIVSIGIRNVATFEMNIPQAVRFNAMKHGILSKLAVLAHEDHAEFADLLAALIGEHRPAGMTERHLIEELATIIWRKRRVLLAEGAKINEGLKSAVNSPKSVIRRRHRFSVASAARMPTCGNSWKAPPRR